MADQKSSKCRQRSSRRGGSKRAKLGLPAKAGKRKAPTKAGKHITLPFNRERAAMLHRLGHAFYIRPTAWINQDMKEPS